jgi:phosphatidylinositol alpha-1,6-mannosyltransferase
MPDDARLSKRRAIKRPSLLVLASTFPRGPDDSTPPFVLQLSARLAEHFEVTVVTPGVPGAPAAEVMEGVQVRRFRYFWPRRMELLAGGAMLENLGRRKLLYLQVPFLLLFELIAAFRAARAVRPAVIHAHWFIPQGLIAIVVGSVFKIPVVVTSHGADIYGLRGRFWGAVRRMLASRCEAITVVSHDMANSLDARSRRGERARVLPMGVDTCVLGRNSVPVDGEKNVLFVGRLAKKKGVEYLIQAFPAVLVRHPDARLVIVGGGSLRPQLEELASQVGLADHVRFLGAMPPGELPAV